MSHPLHRRISRFPWRRPAVAALLVFGMTAGCDQGDRESANTQSDAATASSEASEVRIAALLPFAADQLIELGVTPVAVPLLRGDVPEAWDGIPTIAVDHSAGPNLEQLMASDPDVVVTSSVYASFLPSIEQSTGAEIVIMDVESIEDVSSYIAKLGEITDREDDAASLTSSISEQMGDPTTTGDPMRVLAVFGTPHAFYTFLPSSYLGDLVESAGGEMITGDLQSHGVFRGLAPLSMEAVIDRDPDHLLVVFHGPEESARAMLQQDALWGQLKAIRDGQVTFLKDDLYAMRPGSELPRAIAEIRQIMDDARADRP